MKKLLFIPFLLVSVALISSCKGKKEIAEQQQTSATEYADSILSALDEIQEEVLDTDSLFATYERTACFGRCPILKLQIFKSGLIIYEAIKWAEPEGLWYAYTDETSLKNIMEAAENIDFFALDDEYDQGNVTDLPSTIYMLNKDGNHKRIKARYQYPEELKQLQAQFDALIAAQTDWKAYRPVSDK